MEKVRTDCGGRTAETAGKLFLIDGHSLIFRMYYAFLRRPMINSKGEDTSIIYGFTKYLLELLNKEKPTHAAVAFDPPAKTFRHELYPEYKANRSAAPELVKEALAPLTEIVSSLGIPVVMKPGFEADDVIGSLARREASRGFDVYMVTPDKDLGQIIDEHIWQYKPGKSGSESEIVGVNELCSSMGIDNPLQVIDILSIWGDAADNIKGVAGVGEVGAKKLIAKYGSLESILDHTDELSPKLKGAFEQARTHLALSKVLATIRTDVDIDIEEKDLKLDIRCTECLLKLIERYEMNSLRKLIPQTEESVTSDFGADKTSGRVLEGNFVDWKTLHGKIDRQISFSFDNCLVISSGNLYATPLPEEAAAVLADKNIRKTGYSLKPSIIKLLELGIEVKGEIFDIELMHYLLNPERTHRIEILTKGYLGLELSEEYAAESTVSSSIPDLFSDESPADSGKREKTAGEADLANIRKRAKECIVSEALLSKLLPELESQGMMDLYRNVEMPLVVVLASMEMSGVKVDPRQLRDYSASLSRELAEIERDAREMAGSGSLNLSSPRQVGEVIYEKLSLNPRARKNKGGNYPTDEETLNDIKDRHPFVGKVLEYRATKKLISTYLEPLPSLINPSTGKIHTTFNQALTSTGRLSSVKPNLQNIPIRSEKGREIRKAFIPCNEDGFIVSADYSQIELRIMAELSRDPLLVEGFNNGADIHAETASGIFHVPIDQVTREQRRKAKIANFGIIYGISAYGLSQRMEIPRSEAREFIDAYFSHFPKVKDYMEASIAQARSMGYAKTIFGRKRYLPDINSRNQTVRSLAERNAINAPIQGSAADIIKMAMINVDNALKGFRSRMVLQVHDELVLDVFPEELDDVMKIVKYEMENVCHLSIPLSVECNYGKNWLEAH